MSNTPPQNERDHATTAKQVVVVQSEVSFSRWESLLQTSDNWTWLYIGTDTERYYSIRARLPEGFTFINAGQRINELIETHFDAFQNLDDTVDLDGIDPYWITTDVAERNPSTSTFLFHACAYLVLNDVLNQNTGSVLVVVEDWFPAFQFARLARERGMNVTFRSRYPIRDCLPDPVAMWCHKAGQWILAVRSRLRFLLDFINQKRIIRAIARTTVHNPARDLSACDALLVIWAGPNTLPPDRPLETNTHFGDLPKRLRERGFTLGLIVTPMTWKHSFEECAGNALQAFDPTVMPQGCLGWFDAVRIAWKTFFHSFRIRTSFIIDGMDLTSLLREEFRIEKTKTRQCRACQMFSIGGYLKKHGARPSVIFNVFENQPREKALLLGIKRHFPQTAVWGYQHSTIPYLWVGYFPSKRDIEYQIFPDRIIANGPVWKDLLILRGIPSNRIDIGASLRYSHIFEQTESGPDDHPHSSHPTDHVILLALPYYYPVSLECLIKTVQAFYDTPDIQVQIKFHPLMSGTIENCFDIVQQTLGLDSIPPHIQVVDQPISSLLHSTHLLLYSGTTVGFEFLTQGIPVIMIQSDLRIDLDPLTVFKDRYDCIWTADALRKTALQRLREIHEPHDRRSESTSALLHKTFTPITPETRDVFLQVPKMKSETVRSLPERRDIRLV